MRIWSYQRKYNNVRLWSIEEAKELRAKGVTYKEIANIVKAPSMFAVFQAFKRMGLTSPQILKRQLILACSSILEEILLKGKISIRSRTSKQQYRIIRYQGIDYIYSHILWNFHYPYNIVEIKELVHHKNLNSLDDRIENYEKMTKGEHNRLHKSKRAT